ncbi:MAG: hypothetical protein KF718_26840 [Polyangiaceae bacterium]|nr:hypothetical protein [Polyangiaceae bacterium]
MTRVLPMLLASLLLACNTGEGEGEVQSDRLYIESCWNGPFDLKPTFFGANPYRNTVTIRVQRGDNIQEVSDGLLVLVNDVAGIRGGQLRTPLRVGMPPGVSPPGVPVVYDPDPPLVHLVLYLHDTCHAQNSALYSIDGSIEFSALFSGNPNEESADDRLTEASFSASFADPRHIGPDGSISADQTSTVTGWFRFFFERGQPAQPFP